ncbi:MAG: NarL family transcriptional regulator [Geobacteraceae bacterium GWC2_53_11]|nr:MAG: NarL family transcriptional regulator [Geobacteraceae bacterium GWC2_53_11]
MIHKAASGGLPTAIAISPNNAVAIIASRYSDTPLHDDLYVRGWIEQAQRAGSLNTMLVPINTINNWKQDAVSGDIGHDTGRFFSVIGVHCRHRVDRHEIEWDQPIIEQPETGILGILTKSIGGVLHFCLQAKEEPGNISGIQLSPTVQATYSNYTGAHGGTTPPFLEQFITPATERIIFARLQTEDGGRFLYKSNRNMIVAADDDVPEALPDSFIWLTLHQIVGLIARGNLVNACTRSILSSTIFAASQSHEAVRHGEDVRTTTPDNVQEELRSTLQWLDDRRAANHMLVRRIGLNGLREWEIDAKGFFSHREKRFFRIVGLSVSSGTREVRTWGQPIIENPAAGIIGLLVRNSGHGLEVLMQAKAEAGNRSTVQLGPTVQFTQSNYEGSRKLVKPFLYDDFLEPARFRTIHESRQTEEGARFYREYHLHRILMAPDGADLQITPDYRWLPLEQVVVLLHLGEQVNSCARSILSCLL